MNVSVKEYNDIYELEIEDIGQEKKWVETLVKLVDSRWKLTKEEEATIMEIANTLP